MIMYDGRRRIEENIDIAANKPRDISRENRRFLPASARDLARECAKEEREKERNVA